ASGALRGLIGPTNRGRAPRLTSQLSDQLAASAAPPPRCRGMRPGKLRASAPGIARSQSARPPHRPEPMSRDADPPAGLSLVAEPPSKVTHKRQVARERL